MMLRLSIITFLARSILLLLLFITTCSAMTMPENYTRNHRYSNISDAKKEIYKSVFAFYKKTRIDKENIRYINNYGDNFLNYLDKNGDSDISMKEVETLVNSREFIENLITGINKGYISSNYNEVMYLWLINLYEDMKLAPTDYVPIIFYQASYDAVYIAEALSKKYPKLTRYNPDVFNGWKAVHSNFYYLKLSSIDVNSNQELPRICLSFNTKLDPMQQFDDLVKINGKKVPLVLSNYDYELCFDGKWQTSYEIEISDDLHNKNGPLLEDVVKNVRVNDRDPMLFLASKGNVLNAYSEQKIAIGSINNTMADIQLLQLSYNNLSQSKIQSIIQNTRGSVENYYLEDLKNEDANLLYKGTVDFKESEVNKPLKTNIYLNDMVDKLNPGVYIFAARAKRSKSDYDSEWIIQSFMVSNEGLTSYTTAQGLWVEVRGLDDLSPKANREVILYSKGNEILAKAMTNESGIAKFPKEYLTGIGAKAPMNLIIYDPEHLAFLNIYNKGYDLSSNGLTGAIVKGMLNPWFWSDRGIYRPNDELSMLWLLKNKDGTLYYKTPVWAKWSRPDGKVVLEKAINPDASGAYSFDYKFLNTAALGSWSLDLSLGKNGIPLGHDEVLVDPFIPKQLSVKFNPVTEPAIAEKNTDIILNGQWLYGGNVTDNTGTAQWWLSESSSPWAKLTGWQIGLQEQNPVYTERKFMDIKTDNEGNANLTIPLTNLPISTRPLLLNVLGGLNEPSGDLTLDNIIIPIKREHPYVALKQLDKQKFTVRLINHDGEKAAGLVKWTLYRKEYSYYWYKVNSSWNYRITTKLISQKSGSIDLTKLGDDPLLQFDEGDGSWRLEVLGSNIEVAGDINYNVGTWKEKSFETRDLPPNQLEIKTDKPRYSEGDTVLIKIKTPFNGKGSLHLARDAIEKSYEINAVNKEATLSFKWDKKWDQGLWILATVYNPELAIQQKDYRAVGLTWIGGNYEKHQLDLDVKLPEKVESDSKLILPIKVSSTDGTPLDPDTWVNVAIVDDGIYQLAKPSFSNALVYFMRKTLLDLNYNDVYGNFIRVGDGIKGELRTGADGELDLNAGMSNLPEIDVKIVKYWSGPLQVDADGNATITMDIPKYNGQLRIMATTWNHNRVGSYEHKIKVKSPLVLQLNQPLYLAVGDKAPFRIRMDNTTTEPMNIKAKVSLSDPNDQTVSLTTKEVSFVLAAGADKTQEFGIEAKKLGRTVLNVSIDYQAEGENKHYTDSRSIDIRSTSITYSTQSLKLLQPGEQVVLKTDMLPFTNIDDLVVTISSGLILNVEQWLEQLEAYPYGCVEQTTSTVWPLLQLNSLSQKWGFKQKWSDKDLKERIKEANLKLIDYQGQRGSFDLWGGDSNEPWLTAYVMEYWLAAKKANLLEHEGGLKLGIKWLQSYVDTNYIRIGNAHGYSYALYILAKSGNAKADKLLKLAGFMKDKINELDTLPLVQYASSLIYAGKLKDADLFLNKLRDQEFRVDHKYRYGYSYGSSLRDLVKIIVILNQLNDVSNLDSVKDLLAKYTNQFNSFINSKNRLSTQELVWLVELAKEVPSPKKAYNFIIDGTKKDASGLLVTKFKDKNAVTLINTSNVPLYAYGKWSGLLAKHFTLRDGFEAKVNYYDLSGKKVDLNNIRINQNIVIAYEFEKEYEPAAQIILAQLIPAGFAINDMALPARFADNFIQPLFSENRDDRHIAAFSLGYSSNTHIYHYAFIVRAARAGDWVMPGLSIEDMYAPNRRLQNAEKSVHIIAEDKTK